MNDEFIWDDWNIDHLAGHNVRPEEAEDAFLDTQRVPTVAHTGDDERRYAVIGRTGAGRILVVVFALVSDAIYVITAYDASDRRKRQYCRRNLR